MATFFRNKVVKNVGSKPVEIVATEPTSRFTIIGLSCTNLTTDFVYISVYVEDDTSNTGFYLKDTLLPANTSIRAVQQGEKLIMAPENKLLVSANLNDAVDVIVSYVEIT